MVDKRLLFWSCAAELRERDFATSLSEECFRRCACLLVSRLAISPQSARSNVRKVHRHTHTGPPSPYKSAFVPVSNVISTDCSTWRKLPEYKTRGWITLTASQQVENVVGSSVAEFCQGRWFLLPSQCTCAFLPAAAVRWRVVSPPEPVIVYKNIPWSLSLPLDYSVSPSVRSSTVPWLVIYINKLFSKQSR